ncbi:hypothetical protein A0H81_10712 [Grifola frondosa]|uniref:ADP-ribose 1''-phosphate phosphatase n=1 Tax=Grifola frondosa TaxID=5627 RepID=A0A1C7LX35_GRIFR|nr:hypothetical protein A0H81_10712 [Grifola frondosa]
MSISVPENIRCFLRFSLSSINQLPTYINITSSDRRQCLGYTSCSWNLTAKASTSNGTTSTLQKLEPSHSDFDCIVSPANSYGIMDGGFDYYLSAAFSPSATSWRSPGPCRHPLRNVTMGSHPRGHAPSLRCHPSSRTTVSPVAVFLRCARLCALPQT